MLTFDVWAGYYVSLVINPCGDLMRIISLFFSLMFGLYAASPCFAQETEKKSNSEKPTATKSDEVKDERTRIFTYNPAIIDPKKDKLHKVVGERRSKAEPAKQEEKGK